MAKFNFLRIFLVFVFGVSLSTFTQVWGQAARDLAVHWVQKEETLYSISKRYGMTVTELKDMNRLVDNTIYIDQPLAVINPQPVSTVPVTRGMNSGSMMEMENLSDTQVILDDTWRSSVILNDQVINEVDIMASDPSYTDTRSISAGTGTLPPRVSARELPPSVKVEKRTWYQVKEGDDLFSIADTYEISVEQLKDWNNIQGVKVGDVIIVRKWYEEVASEELATEQDSEMESRSLTPMSQTDARRLMLARENALNRLNNPTSTARTTSRSTARVMPAAEKLSTSFDENEIPVIRTSDRMVIYPETPTRRIQETGRYVKYEIQGYKRNRFYGAHKILPPGSRVKLDIPNNSGYIEVLIIDTLPEGSQALIGLSPACIDILKQSGSPSRATILYE